jgi:hypothetical protein
MSTSETLSCSTRVSSSVINKARRVRLLQATSNGYSTRQHVPLFLLRSDLFFYTSSSLFACISWTSLWYWAKAPSRFD